MVAYYDNSVDNPRNPSHPPKRVTWGEQTTDEMAICFIGLTVSLDNQDEMNQLIQLHKQLSS
jgi:hypothetical protein